MLSKEGVALMSYYQNSLEKSVCSCYLCVTSEGPRVCSGLFFAPHHLPSACRLGVLSAPSQKLNTSALLCESLALSAMYLLHSADLMFNHIVFNTDPDTSLAVVSWSVVFWAVFPES